QGFARVFHSDSAGPPRARPGAEPVAAVFRAGARELAVDRPVALSQRLAEYLRLGVEHIATGYDHLAFLAALLLAAVMRRGGATPEAARVGEAVRTLLKVVTAFTV